MINATIPYTKIVVNNPTSVKTETFVINSVFSIRLKDITIISKDKIKSVLTALLTFSSSSFSLDNYFIVSISSSTSW